MADGIEPLERLADMFRRLGGVGKKTAARYAYCVLNLSDEEAAEFAGGAFGKEADGGIVAVFDFAGDGGEAVGDDAQDGPAEAEGIGKGVYARDDEQQHAHRECCDLQTGVLFARLFCI